MVKNPFRRFFNGLNEKIGIHIKTLCGIDRLEQRLEYLEKLKLMKYPKEHEMQPSLNDALLEIDSFGKFAKSQVCPFCHTKDKITVSRYEHGVNGWELTIVCGCGYTGTVNTTGFRFEHIGRH